MRKEWERQGDGGETIVRTCAWSPPGCHPVGCGLLLHVKDGKLVKVEGDPEHPITRGALCPRCLALKDYVYHPDRITHPMKRDPKDRGKDAWERITWEEAYDLICTKVNEVKETYGPEAIMVFGGTGRIASTYYPMIALNVFGTPNACYAQSGMACYYPRVTEMAYVVGSGYPEIDYASRYPDRYDHPGWEPPKYILVWGKEPLKSNPDGLWGHSVVDLMKLGSKVICVDPRVTWLGSRADMVLQLRPGTDAALAMAMVNVVIQEDLYDHDFVDRWVYGFAEFAERVAEMTPEKAEEITWVPAAHIREAARKFATGKHSALAWGLALDQNVNGPQAAMALIALLCITDNLDVPGGCVLSGVSTTDSQKNRYREGASLMTPDLWEKRIGAKEYPGICDIDNHNQPDVVLDVLESGKPYQIHLGYFNSTNIVDGAIAAQPRRWKEALKKLDFMVCSDTFMNPTAMALADVFLPLSTFAEYNGFVLPHYGLNDLFYATINKAVSVGECRSDIEILIDLGKRLQPNYWNQFADDVDFLEKLKLPDGYTFEQLREQGVVQPDVTYRKYEKGLMRADGQPGFNTRTGRIELYCLGYAAHGDDPLPYYMEPPYSPVSTPELAEEYPLVLTSGARTYVSFHSEHRQIRSLRAMHPDPLLDVHPQTAAALGIRDGAWVWIETPWGKCTQKAHVTKTTLPGVVHAEHAWWFPEQEAEEPHLYGHGESNINTAMPHHVIGKLGICNTFKSQICKVYRNDEKN